MSKSVEMMKTLTLSTAGSVETIVLTVAIGLWAVTAGDWWILILCAVFTFANVQGLAAERSRG